jgi:actin related protein 2/3 complex, subunit 1A/1B
MLVSGLDWHPVTGLLVSVGHDRNAFVWAYDAAADAWAPQVVVLRVSKAALDVKWNAAGDAFAVSSSCKQAMVCRFEPSSNWWVSSGVKKAKSTVTAVAWHPSGDVLATGSTDFRCRVLAARLPNAAAAADGKLSASSAAQFGPLPEFGSEMLEWEPSRVRHRKHRGGQWWLAAGKGLRRLAAHSLVIPPSCASHHPRPPQAWVNDCAWSPSGRQLAFVGHDCAVHVVAFHPAGEAAPTLQVRARV